MNRGSTGTLVLQHLTAAAISGALFVAVPIIFVVAAMVIGDDPGGPMFFPIFALLAMFCAGCAVLGLVCVVVALEFLRRLIRFSWWVPPALAFPLALTAPILLGADADAGLLLSAAIACAAFCTYWLVYCSAGGIIRFVWDRLNRRRLKTP